ncbi:MAG TPA: hypothetical protein VFQ84_00405 [Arenimonas sp.]|uniref:hypothetical protein n=1 Tax=Arenimonas sp. TaxID=1872635 RepID=UPI002D804F15|nr:hypothetical protein [Arenimonas sp.]HEU0151782.1 hypothetical protein [Arenimonas sp.]
MPHLARLVPALLLLATGVAHAERPTTFPEIDPATATYRLAVVELEDQGELPQFAACSSPDVLCMDGPPIWFRARVLDTLQGPSLPAQLHGATTSHYGPMQMASPQYGKARLMLLMSDGERHVMPRYANGFLAEDRDGFLHLVLVDPRPVWWLPCGAMDLKEPIHDAALARSSRIPLEHYEQFHAPDDSAAYTLRGRHAYPKHSIPMAKLAAWLARRRDLPANLQCRPIAAG